jgi:hypothetical protein
MDNIKSVLPYWLKKYFKKAINHYSYYRDYYFFNKNYRDKRLVFKYKDRYPCIEDKTETTYFDSHYLYHTDWAARILAKYRPDLHVDIGSCLRFITIASAIAPIDFYDYRPPDIYLSNLNTKHVEIAELPFEDSSVRSLSCMHVLEHIGLGRYGDPLDPDGDLKGANELIRVLAKKGNLLFVVPISGEPRIEFNAHRIYSYNMIVEMFSELKLVEFSLIPDNAIEQGIINNATEELADEQKYGCGCFNFVKNA